MYSLDALRLEPRCLGAWEPATLTTAAPNMVHGLIDMLTLTGRLERILEVGSFRGVSTEVFLHFCNHLIAVDTWKELSRAKRDFDARFSTESNVSYLRMFSVDAAKLIGDKSVDLVYIDALHDEKSVTEDITAWLPKTKTWIAGHDWPDVQKAVRKFFQPDQVFSDTSWLKLVSS